MVHEYEQHDGLHRVSGERPDACVNVVFVHGLGGGAYSTWNSGEQSETKFWTESIAREHPKCGVWTLH